MHRKSITYTHSVMRPSAHGWRLTFFDAKGEPVASFWALTRSLASQQAKTDVMVSA